MPKVALPPLAHAENFTHPILGPDGGPCAYQQFSDLGGPTQFGGFIEVLPPGSRSSFRHWHETEDEMVYMLAGEVVLVEDRETTLSAGDCAAWPAGYPVGRCLENRSAAEARYLVIGTRTHADTWHCPDHDLITHKEGTARRHTHADGRPHSGGTPR